jgi:hypothetical protein
MPNPFSYDPDTELPSPFNRIDEPARPASDTIRPVSIDGNEEGEAPNNRELGLVEKSESRRLIPNEPYEEIR